MRFRHDGFEREAQARCEVIPSAGSIASPQILERSGIGSGERLREHGVEVVQNSRELVKTYRITVARFCCRAKDVETFNEGLGCAARLGNLRYAFKRTGPLTTAPAM